ncbi:hypothetical protein LJB42_000670 [Komagataella kurtzmanii]|nr:hypothetical protein LJB42_000670 [Komagataella kurtzmanii]
MAKLLLADNCQGQIHLVVGLEHLNLCVSRVKTILEAGATPVLVSPQKSTMLDSLQDLATQGTLKVVDQTFSISQLTQLGRDEVDNVVDKVFVVLDSQYAQLKKDISDHCKRLRIPVSVVDSPELCSFTLLSTYSNADFQLGVTTNGKGCKLASRIKRELVSTLPSNIDKVCENIGNLRHRIQQEDNDQVQEIYNRLQLLGEDEDDAIQTSRLNQLVEEFNMTKEQKKLQRTRWLSQLVEYYPLGKLAEVSVDHLSAAYHESSNNVEIAQDGTFDHAKKGSISLVGAGPGAISLLTLGALSEIYSADLILADKLVPTQVLDLIPRRTEVFIARKFPGNAEAAQQELLSKGLAALDTGKKVIRLKQGDPYIFGRGGEEYLFFESQGYKPLVLPGITSALAAPVLSQIPATHRDVADQVLICTGTGRRGALPNIPEFVKSRTSVFLMALHRIVELLPVLFEKGWDPKVPAAIVERASCPDQRVIRTTLENVGRAVQEFGSRPPGLLVVGYSCGIIEKLEKEWEVVEGWDDIGGSTILDTVSNLSK